MVKRRDLPANAQAAAIVKVLDRNSALSGYRRPTDLFAEWLHIVELTLLRMPAHLKTISQLGVFDQDPPEVQEVWKRVGHFYGTHTSEAFGNFREAFGLLCESADPDDMKDLLGPIYMAWVGGGESWGQFFTPMSLSQLLALMLMDVDENRADLVRRVQEAIARSPHPELTVPADDAEWEAFIRSTSATWGPFVGVFALSEPACGSGGMLLAGAQRFPRWALTTGLVQLHGIDLDPNCTRMTRVNLMLYGLCPDYVICGNALIDSPTDITQKIAANREQRLRWAQPVNGLPVAADVAEAEPARPLAELEPRPLSPVTAVKPRRTVPARPRAKTRQTLQVGLGIGD